MPARFKLFAALALLPAPACAEAPQEAPRSAAETFVYRGAGCTGRDRIGSFEQLIGRPVSGISEFSGIENWTDMINSIDWALGCWESKPHRLSQSVPMLMREGSGTTLAQGAAGAYDEHFFELGKLLVARGQADAYLRIGWEFNGNWYPWAAASDPRSFKIYFRRIVRAFRRVPGQRFRIVWNPAQGEQQIAPDKVYPGDDVVDVIAIDLYNQSWRPQDATDPQARWRNLLEMPYGLDWLRAFATLHGKPMALPEWGTGTRPDGHGWGDDPLFVANVAAFIRANDFAYHGYWDYNAGDFNGEISTGVQPRSAEAFRRAFGRR